MWYIIICLIWSILKSLDDSTHFRGFRTRVIEDNYCGTGAIARRKATLKIWLKYHLNQPWNYSIITIKRTGKQVCVYYEIWCMTVESIAYLGSVSLHLASSPNRNVPHPGIYFVVFEIKWWICIDDVPPSCDFYLSYTSVSWSRTQYQIIKSPRELC